jgi:hypothetical protein
MYTPLLIAKIFDPVIFDDGGPQWFDPFTLRDLGLSYEIERYDRLMSLQGNGGAAFLWTLCSARAANVILPEQAAGTRHRAAYARPRRSPRICLEYKEAIIDGALVDSSASTLESPLGRQCLLNSVTNT